MKTAFLCAAAFLLLGLAFVHQTGIEEDEAIFATALFRDWCFYAIPFGHHRLPLMHMSYLGALKTWLCAPVFWIWPPSPASIRVPAILMGCATILLFWFFLERAHSRRAAIAGCVLLATDTVFLLTTTFDWGPVALQHLLTVAAVLLAVLWYQDRGAVFLIASAFCCGLAFWDKAIFGWVFIGLVIASLIFTARIRRRLTAPTAALSIAALALGALPLIVYNVAATPRLATIRSNAQFTAGSFRLGAQMLRFTWNGSGLLGIAQQTAPRPSPPPWPGIAAHNNLIEPALIIALVLLPFLWRTPARPLMLFSLIAMAVAWPLMLLSGGGLSAHHIILLWPLPVIFLAAPFAEVSTRVRFGTWIFAASLVALAAANLLVTNQYRIQLTRYGSADAWTDAIYPLAAGLAKTNASQAILVDWGISDQLCVLNRNDPPAHPISMPINAADLPLLADDKAIWVEHTPGHEIVKGVNEALDAAARRAGYTRVPLETYTDRSGRPLFQTFRFRR